MTLQCRRNDVITALCVYLEGPEQAVRTCYFCTFRVKFVKLDGEYAQITFKKGNIVEILAGFTMFKLSANITIDFARYIILFSKTGVYRGIRYFSILLRNIEYPQSMF